MYRKGGFRQKKIIAFFVHQIWTHVVFYLRGGGHVKG